MPAIKCLSCNINYEVDNVNISVKRFKIMTKEKRATWKCNTCCEAERNKTVHSQNITLRRKAYSIEDISKHYSLNSSTLDTSICLGSPARSLPNTSLEIINVQSMEMKEEILFLKQNLDSAHAEIDHLNIENNELKNQIQQLNTTLKAMKQINSPVLKNKMSSTPKRRTSILRDRTQVKLAQSQEIDNNTNIQNNTQINNKTNQQISNNTKIQNNDIKNEHYKVNKEPEKILIICNEEGKGVRQVLQPLLGTKHMVQSIIKPGAKINNLINDGLSHCTNFTKSDYVIVIGGSNDDNPLELQSNLYHLLKNLSHTNVILTDIYRNKYLNVNKISELYRLLSNQFEWVIFNEYLYYFKNRYHINNRIRSITLGRSILRNILRLNYSRKRATLVSQNDNSDKVDKKVVSKYTQTDGDENDFFRK